jgi:glycosyltransferase involved in cell wall biosynthesis
VVTDSHHSKHEIEENLQIPGKKIHVIYPIISRSIAVPRTAEKIPDQLPKKPYCLYVGDINWNKNLLNIARAIKIAKIPCVCIGKAFFTRDNLDHPEKREFKKFIAETENDPLFIFPGYVSDQELLAYYTHAVCNILVSRDEGFGYSYFEAAACSTPSVLSDRPIFHETARSAALFADPENPADIAAQILTFAQNAKTQKEYALYANHRLSDFTDEAFTNSYKELVASLS